jgi:prepilin-type N-terminal cleavage/methylation domain-containing protein
MFQTSRPDRGFSLIELLMVIAVAGTMMAIAVPVMNDLSESSKLGTATRELERELQTARLRAVQTNRVLRVRLNCPTTGYFRIVAVGTPHDTQSTRCLLTNYPYPAATNPLNPASADGPLKLLSHQATMAGSTLEFRPDGRVYKVTSTNTVEIIASSTPELITITRKGKSRVVEINGAGRIQLQ